MLGAFAGAVLVYLAYLPHWKPTEDKGLKLGVFCTGPAIRNIPANCLTEIIGTFVLVFVVIAIGAKAVGATGVLGPLMVGLLVWARCFTWRPHRLCDQSGTRSRTTHRPCIAAYSGKRQLGLVLCRVPVAAPIIGGFLAITCAKAAGMM